MADAQELPGKHFHDHIGREWVSVSLTQSPVFAQACLDAWRQRCQLDKLFPDAPKHLGTVRQWRLVGAGAINVPAEVLPAARKQLAAQVAAARERG